MHDVKNEVIMENPSHKILIVDDEPAILQSTSLFLQSAGYNTITLSEPRSVQTSALTENPDLIILDWMMPGMEGIEVLQLLKTDERTKEIPVIISTGMKTDSANLKTALDLGADDFLRKPVDRVELVARVNSVIKMYGYFKSGRENQTKLHEIEKELLIQEARKIKEDLDKKRTELISNALQLIQKNEMTGGFVSDLNAAIKDMPGEEAAKIRLLIKKYDFTAFELNWNEFEKRFEELHKDFYFSLLNHFPGLTPNERKLCALFRLDMTNKEIAILTFTSYAAIRKARYRLRKKLGLDGEDQLVGFLYKY